ncbi:hypothetical protein PENTCL1PPCAC_20560, partial [Pristionchus entomophagus]
SYCLLFSFFRSGKECAKATNANQTLHKLINTLPADKFVLEAPSVNRATTYRIVFLVISATYEREERDEIRRTWTARDNSQLRMMDDALVIFVVGRSPFVAEEALEHRDILQADVEDTYRNMVYKIEVAFRWVRSNVNSEFVVKVDSDTVIHVDRLSEQLQLLDQRGSSHWMACFHNTNSRPVRDKCHNW